MFDETRKAQNRINLFQRQNNSFYVYIFEMHLSHLYIKEMFDCISLRRDEKNTNLSTFRKSQFYDWIKASKLSKLISYFRRFIIICIDVFRAKSFLLKVKIATRFTCSKKKFSSKQFKTSSRFEKFQNQNTFSIKSFEFNRCHSLARCINEFISLKTFTL